MTNLTQKTVLVTGAGGGFGQQMVQQLLDRQCRLIVTDVDTGLLARLRALAADRAGEIVMHQVADLSVAAQCQRFAEECLRAELVPDVLINNAGIAVAGRHVDVPAERWETLISLNLLAPMRLVSHFLTPMIKRGGGHIVNISSLAGWVAAPGISAYAAAKFGLRGFGESLAADERKNNIQVSNVYPSFCRTPILASEQFGQQRKIEIPEKMIFDPARVVAEIFQGVEQNQLHIFPDKVARRTHYLQRFFPRLIAPLSRRLQANR